MELLAIKAKFVLLQTKANFPKNFLTSFQKSIYTLEVDKKILIREIAL
jgi:hypothetical protein